MPPKDRRVQQAGRKRDAASRADRPLFLPAANPPEKNPILLAIAAVLFAAWVVFLAFLAL